MTTNHHNHARYKTTADGRFVMWKNLHFGTRGNAGSEYLVSDETNEFKTRSFDNQMTAECLVQNRVYGLELAPFFGTSDGFCAAKDGHVKNQKKLFTVTHPEYKEIKNA